MSNNATVTPRHVAVLAFPYGTHAAPLHAIIRHLAILSPQTHFTFLSTPESNAALFSTQNPSNLLRRDVPEPLKDGRIHHFVMTEFMSTSEEVFRKEVEVVEMEVGRKVTCLVTDAFYGFAAEMAAAMGVGWVAFWTAGTASLTAHFHTDLIIEKTGLTGHVASRQSDMLDFVPGLSKIQVQDLPGEVSGDLEKPFNKALHQMARALPRATAVFINSFEALDPTITADLASKFQKFLNVGPLNLILKQPASLDVHECLHWLDTRESKSVAYISFGTVTCPPPHELAAIAQALEESQTPYIWSLKDQFRVHLPEGFLDRTNDLGKIVPWAPQVDILAHSSTGVFITHCGWNSVLEGVISGVPMIGRPFFGDQQINARVISTVLLIGSVVEGGIFTKNGLMENLEVILAGKEGQKMRERAEDLKKAAKEAVEENGSSVRNMKLLLERVKEVSK